MNRRFRICKTYPFTATITRRMQTVMNIFGLNLWRLGGMAPTHSLNVELCPGNICYITGPSGSGKSTLLREMYNSIDPSESLRLEDIPIESDKSLIDSVEGPIFEIIKTLNQSGLSDVFAILQQPSQLSAGQQFRYRLARAMISHKNYIFADEFMASLDPLIAAVVCSRLRWAANRSRKIFVFAGVGDHFLPDLLPDVLIIQGVHDKTRVIYRNKNGVL